MSSMQRSTLKRNERGIAAASEYVLLLGMSMLIFTAACIGFGSFGNTASADARSAAAYHIAVRVSERISGMALGGASAEESIDLPGRICGSPYVIYPSRGGRSVCVLVGGIEQEAPILAPAYVEIKGLIVSLPAGHRIGYDAPSRTVRLA